MEDRGTSVSDSMPELVQRWLFLERKDGGGSWEDTLKLVMVSVIGQETASCHLNSGEQEVCWILP